MDSKRTLSAPIELHANAGACTSTIPVRIQLNPDYLEVSAREIDLVLSVLDDIMLEMQRLQLQSDSL